MIVPQSFYFQDTEKVARELLGKILHFSPDKKNHFQGRIVETEAYLGVKDAAAHSFGDRKTARTQVMYLAGGHSYVYLIYGMYHCLNFVTQEEGNPQAVLIRAVEPVPKPHQKIAKKDLLTNGPGKLCRAWGLSREHNGLRLWKRNSGLWLEDDGHSLTSKQIVTAPRIGVDYAGEAAQWPLRFYSKDSPWVSRR